MRMALHSTPLLIPEGPQPPIEGVEVYLTESHNVLNGGVDEAPTSYRGMTVLVSFSADEYDWRALWPIRHALAFGQTSHWTGTGWPDRLAERVSAGLPQFATAVVFVGTNADVVAETVQSAIDALHGQFASALAAVIVVSESCGGLASLRGVTGFVRGAGTTSGETARQVFLCLSVFLAPETLNGIDMVDFLPVLGPANAPTVVAEALWIREGKGHLVYPSSVDQQAIASAGWIVAMPFVRGGGWGWSELSRLQRALRETTDGSATSITFATNNAVAPGLLPTSIGWVPILCLPAASPITPSNRVL